MLTGEKHNKITTGFVIQTYDGSRCIKQEFVAGDQVDYENMDGEPVDVNVADEQYQPFHMIQPEKEIIDYEWWAKASPGQRVKALVERWGMGEREAIEFEDVTDAHDLPDPIAQDFEVSDIVDISIMVEGGLIQEVNIPEHLDNVEIVVRDYDTDGGEEDNVKEDDYGTYRESRYGAR